MATTTIQISRELKALLDKRKTDARESYEDVIWDLYEDTAELSAATKLRIEQSRKEIAEGKYKSFEQIKAELKL
jgi:hypothetical protein